MSKERTTADILVELAALLPVLRVVARWVFAAMAMQGIRANHTFAHWDGRSAAGIAVDDADALIAELEKRNGGAA